MHPSRSTDGRLELPSRPRRRRTTGSVARLGTAPLPVAVPPRSAEPLPGAAASPVPGQAAQRQPATMRSRDSAWLMWRQRVAHVATWLVRRQRVAHAAAAGAGQAGGTQETSPPPSSAASPRGRLGRAQPQRQRIHHPLNQSTRSAPPFVINYANQQTITLR